VRSLSSPPAPGLLDIDDVDDTAEVEEEADVKPSEQELCDNRSREVDVAAVCRFDMLQELTAGSA
jgi:hypothetical protein